MQANRETEMAVLAAIIASPIARKEAQRRITGADFEHVVHERVWDAVTRLERHGRDVGWITVQHVLASDRDALALMPHLVTLASVPEQVGSYAEAVRDAATKRRLEHELNHSLAQVRNPQATGRGLATSIATRFAAVRDSGVGADDMTALTLEELLAMPEEEYDWVIPDLIERSDRLVLTGEEGLGKSHVLRQIAVMAAAGLHPFAEFRIKPCKALVIDCENTWRQVNRKIRPLVDYAKSLGQDPTARVMVDCPGRMDITADKDLARIHHQLDALQPDLLVIGPLYRLVPRAVQTDDEAAPLLTALDSIRDRGISLLIEAHSGHSIGKQGHRDMRPRGSSALLGWPEFGYGMRSIGADHCDLVPWRGDRDERDWPDRLMRAHGGRWVPADPMYVIETTR